MWRSECFIALFLSSIVLAQASGVVVRKQKSAIAFEIAERLIAKAIGLIPDCAACATNKSKCGSADKMAIYLELAKESIAEGKEKCRGDKTKDPCIEEPVTEEPTHYPKSIDCTELFQKGYTVSGIYTIWPNSSLFQNRSLQVYCNMDTPGGGWTVIQRRGKFTPQENFFRDWKDYKDGFGNITKDFWIGNDNLFALTNQASYKIRIDLTDVDGSMSTAFYKLFRIENETLNYKLRIDFHSGNVSNSIINTNANNDFSTKDRDNDNWSSGNCADDNKGGWWYGSCVGSNLNGLYKPGVDAIDSMFWKWPETIGLAATEMKLNRN